GGIGRGRGDSRGGAGGDGRRRRRRRLAGGQGKGQGEGEQEPGGGVHAVCLWKRWRGGNGGPFPGRCGSRTAPRTTRARGWNHALIRSWRPRRTTAAANADTPPPDRRGRG